MSGSALFAKLERYLTVRRHVLSTAHLNVFEKLLGEADYVCKEAAEFKEAIEMLVEKMILRPFNPIEYEVALKHARHEAADVLLSCTALIAYLPGDPTPEGCIEEKTQHDKGRG